MKTTKEERDRWRSIAGQGLGLLVTMMPAELIGLLDDADELARLREGLERLRIECSVEAVELDNFTIDTKQHAQDRHQNFARRIAADICALLDGEEE